MKTFKIVFYTIVMSALLSGCSNLPKPVQEQVDKVIKIVKGVVADKYIKDGGK